MGFPARASFMIGRATLIAIAKPIPCASLSTAVLTPITCPALLMSGPPELPGLMAASVWIRPFSSSLEARVESPAWMWRPSPDTTPE